MAQASSKSCCSVPGCSCNAQKQPYLSFHSFPANKEVRRKWVQAIRRDEGPTFSIKRGSTYVCSRHFTPEDYVLGITVRRLQPESVPSLFPWNEYTSKEKRESVNDRCQKRQPLTSVGDERKDIANKALKLDHDYATPPPAGDSNSKGMSKEQDWVAEMEEEELRRWVADAVEHDERLANRKLQLAKLEELVKKKEREATHSRLVFSSAWQSVLECESVIKGVYRMVGLDYRETDSEEEEEGASNSPEIVVQIPDDDDVISGDDLDERAPLEDETTVPKGQKSWKGSDRSSSSRILTAVKHSDKSKPLAPSSPSSTSSSCDTESLEVPVSKTSASAAQNVKTPAGTTSAASISRPVVSDALTRTATSNTTNTNTKQDAPAPASQKASPQPGDVQGELELKVDMAVLGRRRTRTWHPGTILEIRQTSNGSKYKVRFDGNKGKSLLSAHHLACVDPPKLKDLFVGCRVVACYKEDDQTWFHSAIVAEMPERKNRLRFLVFFEDGRPAYVALPELHLIYTPLKNNYDDIEDEAFRVELKEYLQTYPHPISVIMRVGQEFKVERDGCFEPCTIVRLDASLVYISYKKDELQECIYKGSNRLEHIQRIKKRLAEEKKANSTTRERFYNPKPTATTSTTVMSKSVAVNPQAPQSVSQVTNTIKTTPLTTTRTTTLSQSPAIRQSSTPAQSPAIRQSSTPAQSPAIRQSSTPAQSPAIRQSSTPAQSPAIRQSSTPAQSPAIRQSSATAQSPAIRQSSATTQSPAIRQSSTTAQSPAIRQSSTTAQSPAIRQSSTTGQSSTSSQSPTVCQSSTSVHSPAICQSSTIVHSPAICQSSTSVQSPAIRQSSTSAQSLATRQSLNTAQSTTKEPSQTMTPSPTSAWLPATAKQFSLPEFQPTVTLYRINWPHDVPKSGLKRPLPLDEDVSHDAPLLAVNVRGKYVPHRCSPSCVGHVRPVERGCLRGENPLCIPLKHDFQRIVGRKREDTKMHFHVYYRAPCRRRLCTIADVQTFLLESHCDFLFLEMFCMDPFVLVKRAPPPSSAYTRPYLTLPDFSQGKEVMPVSCINEIDSTLPPFMTYTSHRLPAAGVFINTSPDFMVCCDCTDGCQDRLKCACHRLTIEATALFPGGPVDMMAGYTHKRLTRYLPTGVYECNPRCHCDPWMCSNRLVQHGLQLRLQLFMTRDKGWGIRCLDDISKGTFVCVFTGNVVSDDSASMDAMSGNDYLANLDLIEVVENLKEGYESEAYCSDTEEENDKKTLTTMTTGASQKHAVLWGNSESSSSEENESKHQKYEESKRAGDGHSEDDDDDIDDKDYMVSSDTDDSSDTCPRTYATRKNVQNNTTNNIQVPSPEISQDQMEVASDMGKQKRIKGNLSLPVARKSTGCFAVKSSHRRVKPAKASDPEETGTSGRSTRRLFNGEKACYLIDAKNVGNIGRFINHSCSPNLFVQNVFVDTHDLRFPWVAFFAGKRIRGGTELTWDYSYEVGSVEGKVVLCCCGSSECKGRLL